MHNRLDDLSSGSRLATVERPKAMTKLIEAFSAHLTDERMLATGTAERYRSVIEAAQRRLAQGTTTLQSASRSDLLAFLSESAKVGGEPSKSLWNSRLAALRAFYRFLCEGEIMDKNPAQLIRRHQVKSAERQPLTFDEMLRLVDVVGARSPKDLKRRNVALTLVFIHCALRVAEVVSLDLDQVDLENRLFHQVRRKGGKRLAALFNDVVAASLFDLLEERHNELVVAEGASQLAGPLFTSRRGGRLSIRAVQDLVQRFGRLAGFKRPLTPHILRHSSATELADLTELRVVQEHCAHENIATTQRYVHVKAKARREAVDRLGALWVQKAKALGKGERKQRGTNRV